MPYDYPYYSSATLGRNSSTSSSHWSSTIGSSRSYSSSGYPSFDSSTTYSPSSLSSLYLPPRTPSVPSSPIPSHRHIRQSSQYATSRPLAMSSAMTKRDAIIRTLVRSSHDLESHHFMSNDSVSLITGSNYYQSSSRRALPSQTTLKPNKYSRSYTTDLSSTSALAGSTSPYRTGSPIYTVPERAYRDPYRPIVIERPSLSRYVPPPKEERSKALPRAIRRDRPLIKFLEREDLNPVKVRHMLDAWSKGEVIDEEGTAEDEDENKKRDSVRSNDSGIGSYRSSFLRRSRQKSGDIISDLNETTSEDNGNGIEENERRASLIPKAHTPSVDEGVHLDTDDGFRTPTPIISPLGFRDETVESGDENKLQSSTSAAANDDNPPDTNSIETTRSKRRVRICADKYIDPSNDSGETTNENHTESSRNLNDRRGSNSKRVRTAAFDSKTNAVQDTIDVPTKCVSKSTSDKSIAHIEGQPAETLNNVLEISVKTGSDIITNAILAEMETLQDAELKPRPDGISVQEGTKCISQTTLPCESSQITEPKTCEIPIQISTEKCLESPLAITECLPTGTEVKKKKKVKKLLDGENKKTKITKVTSNEDCTETFVAEKTLLHEKKLSSEANKTDLLDKTSDQLKTKTVETVAIPLKIDQPKDTAKMGISVGHENNKQKDINNKSPSIPTIESDNTRLNDKCEKSALGKMKNDQRLTEKDSTILKKDEPISVGKSSMQINRSEEFENKEKLACQKTLVNEEKNTEELKTKTLNRKIIPNKTKAIVESKPLSTDKIITPASTNASEKTKQSKCDDVAQSTPKLKANNIFGDKAKLPIEQEKLSSKPISTKIKDGALEKNKDKQAYVLMKSIEAQKEEIKTSTAIPENSITVKSELSSVGPKTVASKDEKSECSNSTSLTQPKSKIQTLVKDDKKTTTKVKVDHTQVDTKVLPVTKTELDINTEFKIKRENVNTVKPTQVAVNGKSTSLMHMKDKMLESKIEKIDIEDKVSESKIEKNSIKDKVLESKMEKSDIKDKVSGSKIEKNNIKDKVLESKIEIEKNDIKDKVLESKIEKNNIKDKVSESKIEKNYIEDKVLESKIKNNSIKDKVLESKMEKSDIKDKVLKSRIEKNDIKDKLSGSKIEKNNIKDKVLESKIEKNYIKDKVLESKIEKNDIKDKALESSIEKNDPKEKEFNDEKFKEIETKLKENAPSSVELQTKTAVCNSLKESKFPELKSPMSIPEKPKKLISAEKTNEKNEFEDKITSSVSILHTNTSSVENLETKAPLPESSEPSNKSLKNKKGEIKTVEKKNAKKKQADDSLSILNTNILKPENSDVKPNIEVSNQTLESGTENIPDIKQSETELKPKISNTELHKEVLDQKCKPPKEKSVEEKKITSYESKEISLTPKRKISDALLKTSEIFMVKNKDTALHDKATTKNISADKSQDLKLAKSKVCETIKLKTVISKQKTTEKIDLNEVPQSDKEQAPLDKNASDVIPPKTGQAEKKCFVKLQKSASADSSPDSQNKQKNVDKDVSKLRRSSALDGFKLLGMQPNFDIKKIIAANKLKPPANTLNIQHKADKVISNTEAEIKTIPVTQKTIERSTTEDLSTMHKNLVLLQKSHSADGSGLVKELSIHNLTSVIKPQLQPETKTILPEEKDLKSDLQKESTRRAGRIQRSTTTEIVDSASAQKLNVLQKSSSAGCNNFQNILDTQINPPLSLLQKPPLPIPFPRTAKTKICQSKSTDSKESDAVCKNDSLGPSESNDDKKVETQLKENTDSIECFSTTNREDHDLKKETQLKTSEKESILKIDHSIEQTKKSIENTSQNLEQIILPESCFDVSSKKSPVIKSAKPVTSGKENKLIEETEKVISRTQESYTDSKIVQDSGSAVATKEVQEPSNNDHPIVPVETQVIQPLENNNIQSLQNTEVLPLTENKLNIDGKISTVKVKKDKKVKHEDGEKPKKKKKKKIPIPPTSTDIIKNEPLTVINEKPEDKCISSSNNVENQSEQEELKQRQCLDGVKDTRNTTAQFEALVPPDSRDDAESKNEKLEAAFGDYSKSRNEEMPRSATADLKSVAAENFTLDRRYRIEDFNFLKVLGRGSYGKVMLAELKGRNEYFAVKCLKKEVVMADNDVECTMIEKEVLAMGSSHPYLCTLFLTFQSKSHLFFVMEYLSGGDLMFHIQQSGRFDEDRARFYAAEIVCALRYLHKHGIIYRDAKLDNICIDANGHIRLVDFGFCKLRISSKECLPRNLCGTPDYMAPEIIKGYHYNQSVDWWSFGILLFEMLVGQSPFNGNNEEELFWSVCNEEAQFPCFLSREAVCIILLLLDKNPETRLGMPGCNYGDILCHKFFRHIDWNKVEKNELEPPFKPRVISQTDVSNFDSDFTMEHAALSPTDGEILNALDQTQFRGFTFTNPMIL